MAGAGFYDSRGDEHSPNTTGFDGRSLRQSLAVKSSDIELESGRRVSAGVVKEMRTESVPIQAPLQGENHRHWLDS